MGKYEEYIADCVIKYLRSLSQKEKETLYNIIMKLEKKNKKLLDKHKIKV